MKYLFTLFYLLLFLFMSNPVFAQSSISLGAKAGMGISIPTLAAKHSINNINYELKGNAFYSAGFLGQYILGDRLGIETGTVISYQQYSRKDLRNSLGSLFSIDSSIGIIDRQVPIQIFYNFNHPTNPYKNFKITSGLSIDWLEVAFLNQSYNNLFISKFLAEIRIGNEGKRFGRVEYGLQYQYSLGGFHQFTAAGNKTGESLSIKYSLISFNFYYFFFNRDLSDN